MLGRWAAGPLGRWAEDDIDNAARAGAPAASCASDVTANG
jgi:hypothetical protein